MQPPSITRYWLHGLAAGVLAAGAMPVMAASPNWDSVKGAEIPVFYPGQASWEWILTDHSASKSVRKGSACRECHDGEEKDMGPLLVSGKKLEPTPIAGKPGYTKVNVKFAHDKDRLYVRFEWPDVGFHGAKKMDPDYAEKIAIMFADEGVKESTIAGCWGGCHDDATGMASAQTKDKRSLYLTASRVKLTRQGGGDNIKPDADLQDLMRKGVFMEYWQAKLNMGKPAMASDGYVLEKRHRNDNPAVQVSSEYKNGKWIAVMSRRLNESGINRKEFAPGKTYYFGIVLHDDYTEGRFHYVSFGRSLVLDSGKADLVAAGL